MRKIVLSTLLLSCFFYDLYCQEIFIDINTQDTCLFIGGISPERSNKLKVFEHNKVVFKDLDSLTQVGLLIGNEFTDELFTQGLCFELSGYESYWDAVIFKETLCLWNPEEDRPKYYKINLYTSETSLSSAFFAMFSTECGSGFGTINNIGLMFGGRCRICEYNIPKDEESLFEVYIYITGKAYKGCGTIRPLDISPFMQQFAELELPFSDNELQNIMQPYDGRDVFDEQLFDTLGIKPLQGFNIFPDGKRYYPVGKISISGYTLLLVMHAEIEAGLIDPIVCAYILDDRGAAITDSLEVYRNYYWEEAAKTTFSISQDMLVKVSKYEECDPHYGETENSLMGGTSIVNRSEAYYQVDKARLKFITEK